MRAEVRTLSPLAGLRRRSLGGTEVTAQSVAVTAPSAAMSSTPVLVAASAGNGTMYSYVIGMIVVLLVGYCISQFARRMAAAGSLYSFTAKGFGSPTAMASGVGLLIGYALLSMSTLLLSASYIAAFLRRFGLDVGDRPVVSASIVIALGGLATVCMVRGIALSSRVALAVEGTSIVAILVVLAVLLARNGVHLDLRLVHASGASLHGIGLGVALAITSFVGFESAAALGAEARRPYISVPRAIMRTALGAGLLYLVSSYTQLIGFRDTPGGLAASTTPLTDLAARADASWLSFVLDLGIAASGFACATASATALTRLIFSMAREQVLPTALGRTSARFQTPHVAVLASMAPIVIVPVVLLAAGASPWDGFLYLITISTFGYMLAYILVCLALPRFLHRVGELTRLPLVAGLVAGTVLCGVFIAYIYPLPAAPYYILLWIFVALEAAALVAYAWRARRNPVDAGRIGVYDEPVAADYFDPSWLRAS